MDDEVRKYIRLLEVMESVCRFERSEEPDYDKCAECILDNDEELCLMGIVRTRLQRIIRERNIRLSDEEIGLVYGVVG